MRGTRRAVILALACALAACGDSDGEAPAPEAAGPADPSPATRTEASRTNAGREDTTPSNFDDCPDGTEPRELSIPATETVMRWCERVGHGGARVQHGRWEKLRAGSLVERGAYREGVRDGRWTIYWRGGSRQSEGEYQDGRRSGRWIFYREDGSEIRRIDYSAPDADAIEVSGLPDAAVGEAPLVSLRFENGSGADLLFALEPSTEIYAMPPGASFEVRARAAAGEIVVESTDDGLIVRPGGDAEPVLLVDGVEVDLAP